MCSLSVCISCLGSVGNGPCQGLPDSFPPLSSAVGMSEVIVIDDELPAAVVPRRRRKAATQPIVLDDVSGDEDSTQETPKASRKRKPASKRAGSDSDGQAPPKRQRQKKQKTLKEPAEKRTNAAGVTVRFSAQPSQAIYQRIQRALPGSGHRMFLINTKELAPAGAPGGRSQEFAVLGATGNVYNVTISRHPHCTCPDHAKGNLCKHILFVMLRVLKLATDNPLVWQKALLTKEVEEVLSGAHSQGVGHLAGVLADDQVRQAYAAAAGQEGAEEETAPSGRRPVEGDCAICFDELKVGCWLGCSNWWCCSRCMGQESKEAAAWLHAAAASDAAAITECFCHVRD
eukprot:GHUV01009023.1.p1 GENE.GHUV01009023.1~~GHUV01009023.1.p1  ORF type:complete len:344 (+),score=82.61 GHUV01009023.1:103-1134(+)